MAARTYTAQAEMNIHVREKEFMKLHDILQNLGQTN
jgi:hypothetical protein